MRIDAPGSGDSRWLAMRLRLWPQSSEAEHRRDMADALARGQFVRVALSANGSALGFVEAAKRVDYVNGTNSSPVAFLEGLYVEPGARRKGVARALVAAVEAWAAAQGCTELASDSPLDNVGAHEAHRALGFEETERVVYFRRSLTNSPRSSAKPKRERSYWIGVVSKEHVTIGVKGGFMQLGHGKRAPLQKLKGGDGLVMYSPRLAYPDGEPCQSFTAIGRVVSGEIYQVEIDRDFKPFRLSVEFFNAKDAPIKPLIERLAFIRDKQHWGATFRFGQVKIGGADFALIAKAMGRDPSRDFAS